MSIRVRRTSNDDRDVCTHNGRVRDELCFDSLAQPAPSHCREFTGNEEDDHLSYTEELHVDNLGLPIIRLRRLALENPISVL